MVARRHALAILAAPASRLRYAAGMHAFDTERLHLRPLDARDEALYCSLYTDPALMRHIAAPMSQDAARGSFRVVLARQGTTTRIWVIGERAGGAELGILGVFPDGDAAEVGVVLSAVAQGRGFATEVIAAIADDLFATPGIRRVWTRHAEANDVAIALMRSLGFEPGAGTEADTRIPRGERRWRMERDRWIRRAAEVAAAVGPQ